MIAKKSYLPYIWSKNFCFIVEYVLPILKIGEFAYYDVNGFLPTLRTTNHKQLHNVFATEKECDTIKIAHEE